MKATPSISGVRHFKAPTTLLAGLALCLSAALPAPRAEAQEFVLHLEPAAAFWLDNPQSERFTPGFYGAIRPGIALGRVVSLQWSYAVLLTPPKGEFTESGAAHFALAGVRVRPFGMMGREDRALGGLFVDGNLGYVRTGTEDRFGFDAGLGYGFQVNDWFSLGPVVRYVHIVQPDNVQGIDPNDAQLLTVGVSATFGTPRKAKAEVEEATCPDPVTCPEPVAEKPPKEPEQVATTRPVKPAPCADRDGDGVCDADDRCPDVAGPAESFGCPVDPCSGKPLVVLVQFEQDSAGMPKGKQDAIEMDPVLDAVASAISTQPSCRVCIVGHASIEGPVDYNQTLSAQRATAVQKYLIGRGLAASRLPTIGHGVRCQLEPWDTRIMNRRVDFVRLDEGQSCPTECVE